MDYVSFPQVSSRNSCELLEDPNEDRVNSLAEQLGLRRVGWIFTDLVAQDLKTGTVKHFRGNIVSLVSANLGISLSSFVKYRTLVGMSLTCYA